MTTTRADALCSRWECFYVYGNNDGTFHILVMTGDSGYIVADRIQSESEAEWIAYALNTVLKATKEVKGLE